MVDKMVDGDKRWYVTVRLFITLLMCWSDKEATHVTWNILVTDGTLNLYL